MSAADDRDEIRSLIHAYARRIDSGDLDGVADLFAHARLITGDGQVFSGRETLRTLWNGVVMYDGVPRTHHLITNIDVVIDTGGTTASAHSYVTVIQATPALQLQMVAANRHEDRFEKVDGHWRFTERRDCPELTGDLSHHFQTG
ncbi:MAG TPA: nuclear transport factor 2 family protein [Mycobacteriales bacterium]|nr:nuclear transport factor 2 family protein [Mycobacteriales bacterium]